MRKLSRLLLEVTLSLATASSVAGAGVNLSDWKHLQEVEVRAQGPVRIQLPVSTLDAAQPRLHDLRLLGPAGREHSYLLESAASNPAESRTAARLDARLGGNASVLEIETGTNLPLEAVELDSPHRNFMKAARVEISTDGRKWIEAGNGFPLFRVWGSEQMRIPLGRQRAARIRITVDDARTEPIPFTRATLQLAGVSAAPDVSLDVEIVRREEFVGETVITLKLEGRHAALTELVFETAEPIFTRRMSIAVRELRDSVATERVVATGSLYRLQMEGYETRQQLEFPLHFTPETRELLVHVHNGDAPPLAMTGVRAMRRPTALVFSATQPGTYLLLSGNPGAHEPSYDLAAFAREFRRASLPTAAPSRLEENPSYRATDVLADVALTGSAIEIVGWKHQRSVNPAPGGTQELELDLAVLAHARDDLADLRLVQDGRQVPYLVEQTNLFRSLPLPLVTDNDPKRPTVSRWKVTLPRSNLPLHRIILTSPTNLFERTVRVYERVPTDRGDSYERPVTSAVWRQVPGRDVIRTITMSLGTVVQSRELFIETDNGDNPAIALSGASVTHPVTRIIFKLAGASPVNLHYGNPLVGAPRYDLSLMAAQLLSSTRVPASLGPERTDREGLARQALRGLRGGPIFWISLAAVVIVLLVVVGKLLPKPEEPVG